MLLIRRGFAGKKTLESKRTKQNKKGEFCHLVHWNYSWIGHVHHLTLHCTRSGLKLKIKNKKTKLVNHFIREKK
jgi:hypothetical protein